MAAKPIRRTVTVQLNLQQYQVLEDMRKQGTMGTTNGEVIRRAFLKWYRRTQTGKRGSRAQKTQGST